MVRKSTPAERMSSITWWTSSRCSPRPTISPDLVNMCGARRLTLSRSRSGRDMLRLERIHGARHPRLHVAEGAGPGAGIAQDHHRSVLLGPAFADVGTRRFLADGREIELAHEAPRRVIAFAHRRLDAD